MVKGLMFGLLFNIHRKLQKLNIFNLYKDHGLLTSPYYEFHDIEALSGI